MVLGFFCKVLSTFPDLHEKPGNLETLLPHLHPAPPDPPTLPALPRKLETMTMTTTPSSRHASWSAYGHTWALGALFLLVFLTKTASWPLHGRPVWTAVLDLSCRTTHSSPRRINWTRAPFVSIFILHTLRCLSHTRLYWSEQGPSHQGEWRGCRNIRLFPTWRETNIAPRADR